jgi:hypothetical protein
MLLLRASRSTLMTVKLGCSGGCGKRTSNNVIA